VTENAVMPAPDAGALTLPNVITLAGAGLTAWWLRGGPAWAAVAGLLADEVDGRLARATGSTSRFGATLDWATDISLNAVMLDRLGAAVALPVVLPAQVAMHEAGVRPSIGSLRALTTLALLWQSRAAGGRVRPNPTHRGRPR
jgi:phosphatidylglycerophosphate synthase